MLGLVTITSFHCCHHSLHRDCKTTYRKMLFTILQSAPGVREQVVRAFKWHGNHEVNQQLLNKTL